MNSKNGLVILFAILIITVGQSVDIYLPSLPMISRVLHVSVAVTQLSITIALIGYGLGAPFYGPLSDHFGRRAIALTGILFFIAGSILCMLAVNVEMLLIGRLLQGVGYASSSGVAAPAVCDTFSGEHLVRAFSWIGMALMITPVVAPVFGGYLEHYMSWRAPFAFLLLYGLVLFLLFYKYFPETCKTLRQSSIHPKSILYNYGKIARHPKYMGFIFSCVLVFSGEIFYLMTAPFILQTQFKMTPIQNGWLILITVSGFLMGTFASSKLCGKIAIRPLLLTGCLISIMGATLMLLSALFGYIHVYTLLFPMMIYLVGTGVIYSNAGAGSMACFPENAGAASSLGGMMQVGIAGLISSIATRMHLEHLLPLSACLLTCSILAIGSALWASRK